MTPSVFRILLIDDHAVVRAGYRRFLEHDPSLQILGEAGSAADAYAWLLNAEREQCMPDLAVVDLSLGERSGLDLLDRCSQRFTGLICLVFSMHEDPRLVERALDAGARGYVSKGSDPATLVAGITALRRGERFIDPVISTRESQDGIRTRLDRLTRREYEVLAQMMRGASSEAVAAALCLSPKTISNHLSSIRQKLEVENDFQLVRMLTGSGLPEL